MTPFVIPLSLRPAAQPVRDATAWLVTGRGPSEWLAELARWNVPLEKFRLRPIPAARDSGVPLGVLITCEETSEMERLQRDVRSPQAQPYGVIADRVYVPVDAVLDPPLKDDDWTALLSDPDVEYVWHPSAGLTRVEPEEHLVVSDLLTAPPSRTGRWDLAQPGLAIRSRLISVEPEQMPTLEEFFRDAGEIGSRRNSLDDLPAAPSEWFGGRLHDMTKPIRRGWNGLKNWMAEKLGQLIRGFKRKESTPDQTASRANTPSGANSPNNVTVPSWIAVGLLPLMLLFGVMNVLLQGLVGLMSGAFRGLSGGGMMGSGLSRPGGLSGTSGMSGEGMSLSWPTWFTRLLDPLKALATGAASLGAGLTGANRANQEVRNREVDRLLNMLQSDPDAGLKYAIPMGSHGASRGQGAAGNQLMPRSLDFNLGNLFRGGATDCWAISPQQTYQLMMIYRELAAREIRIGRHRRAAYIFAELLCDLSSAASTLEAGLHFREAAQLYRDKLNQPLAAAKCLERGGLLDDAAEIYIQHKMYELAGEIYLKLERPDDAERLFRQWVDLLVEQRNFLAASRVLDLRLNDVDGALAHLNEGWRNSTSAQLCLEESFALMGRRARHDLAERRITALRNESVDSPVTQLLAQVLAKQATQYPDAVVRELAADTTHVVVASKLSQLGARQANLLLAPLRSLAPADRLLGRDCDRFVRKKEEAARVKSKSRSTRSDSIQATGPKVRLSDERIAWRAAVSAGPRALATGFIDTGHVKGLCLFHVGWNTTTDMAPVSSIMWPMIPETTPILLQAINSEGPVAIHAVGLEPLPDKSFLGAVLGVKVGSSSSPTWRAGSPAWATKTTTAMAFSTNGLAWRVRQVMGALDVDCFNSRGEPIHSSMVALPQRATKIYFTDEMHGTNSDDDATEEIPLISPASEPQAPRITLHVSGDHVRMGMDNILADPRQRHPMTSYAVPDEWIELPSEITGLCGSIPVQGRPEWLLALHEHGASLLCEPFTEATPIRVGEEIEDPVAVFLPGDRFVIAGRAECRVYEIGGLADTEVVLQIGRMTLSSPAFAVTRTNVLGEFALFTRDGFVHRHVCRPMAMR